MLCQGATHFTTANKYCNVPFNPTLIKGHWIIHSPNWLSVVNICSILFQSPCKGWEDIEQTQNTDDVTLTLCQAHRLYLKITPTVKGYEKTQITAMWPLSPLCDPDFEPRSLTHVLCTWSQYSEHFMPLLAIGATLRQGQWCMHPACHPNVVSICAKLSIQELEGKWTDTHAKKKTPKSCHVTFELVIQPCPWALHIILI